MTRLRAGQNVLLLKCFVVFFTTQFKCEDPTIVRRQCFMVDPERVSFSIQTYIKPNEHDKKHFLRGLNCDRWEG